MIKMDKVGELYGDFQVLKNCSLQSKILSH
jgi:hypothetical protein